MLRQGSLHKVPIYIRKRYLPGKKFKECGIPLPPPVSAKTKMYFHVSVGFLALAPYLPGWLQNIELLQLRSRVEIRGALFRGSVVVFRRVSRGAGGWMRRAVGALHCLQVGSLCYLSWIYETSPSRNKLKRLMQKSFHDKRFSSVFIQIFIPKLDFSHRNRHLS